MQTPVQEIKVRVADLGKPSDEKIAALTLLSFVVRLLSNVSLLVIVKDPTVPAVVSVNATPVAYVREDPTSACTVTFKAVFV